MRRASIYLGLIGLVALGSISVASADDEFQYNFAGSVQLDYLAVPTTDPAREIGLDGATAELSLKLTIDFTDNISANAKLCGGCHGMEVGMAYFDLRVADGLNFRVGRFTPAFGNFPLRHDPANHRTSDKPLPYDMGRMLRIDEWNMSVLPAPWVDNGLEISGAVFGENARFDYAAYAIGGPKANADAIDFNFVESRSRDRFYVDNNSLPAFGGRLAGSFTFGENTFGSIGLSGMAGHYDPDRKQRFGIGGADLVLNHKGAFFRAEYLLRYTEMALGDDPASKFKYGPDEDGEFDDSFLKEGFYAELEVPVGRFDLVARWDGMRRFGNVLANSELRSRSAVLRYTAAAALRMSRGLRLKASFEVYDFSDFSDEIAIHLGIASPF